MTAALPLSVSDIHTHIRAAGGIVHGDGNIFFTNAEKFIAAAVLCGEPPFAVDRVRAEAMREAEQDAKRYRWLRAHVVRMEDYAFSVGEDVESYIDAQLLGSQK